MKDKDGDINDQLAQLEANKSVIKDLSKDLLTEIKEQITNIKKQRKFC